MAGIEAELQKARAALVAAGEVGARAEKRLEVDYAKYQAYLEDKAEAKSEDDSGVRCQAVARRSAARQCVLGDVGLDQLRNYDGTCRAKRRQVWFALRKQGAGSGRRRHAGDVIGFLCRAAIYLRITEVPPGKPLGRRHRGAWRRRMESGAGVGGTPAVRSAPSAAARPEQ